MARKKANQAQIKGARTRRIIRYLISIVSILTLNLTLNVVNRTITSQKEYMNSYWLTAIGMLVVLVVFYPAISMKYYVNKSTEWIWHRTVILSAMIMQKKIAIAFVFLLTLFFLYVGFYKIWFGKLLFLDSLEKIVSPGRK